MAAVDDAEFDIEFTAAADIDLVVVGVDGILGEVRPIGPDNEVEEFSAPWGSCMDDGGFEDECNRKPSYTSISSFKRHSSKHTNPRRSDIFLLAQPKQ